MAGAVLSEHADLHRKLKRCPREEIPAAAAAAQEVQPAARAAPPAAVAAMQAVVKVLLEAEVASQGQGLGKDQGMLVVSHTLNASFLMWLRFASPSGLIMHESYVIHLLQAGHLLMRVRRVAKAAATIEAWGRQTVAVRLITDDHIWLHTEGREDSAIIVCSLDDF